MASGRKPSACRESAQKSRPLQCLRIWTRMFASAGLSETPVPAKRRGHQTSRHIAGVLRCSPRKQDGGFSDGELSISISRIDSNIIHNYYKKELIAIYKLSDNLI